MTATTSKRRVRTVVVTQRLPVPPQGGVDLRCEQTVDLLGRFAEVGVAALTAERPPAPAPPGVRAWAQPRREAPRAEAARALAWIREPGGLPSDRWWRPGSAAAVAEVVGQLRPDLVVLEQLHTRRAYEAARAGGARVVLNAYNAEGALHADLAAGEGLSGVPRLLAERAHAAEAALVAVVDQVWACSEEDAALLAAHPGCAPVRVVPNGVDVARYRGRRRPDPSAPLFVLPGSFAYPPNLRAARWLVDEIAPALRAVLPARVAVVGAGPPPALVAAGTERGVEVTGAVEDMVPWLLAATAMPIPVRDGGGTRLKALEAFAAGVPVVATAKAMEGLAVEPGVHYLRAETTTEFVAGLARVCVDTELAARIAERARHLVSERYSRDAVAGAVRGAVDELLSRAPATSAVPSC